MATLQAKKFAAALAKAQGVGQVEEDLTITGCHVVLQSLRPEDYEQIHTETSEKEDLNYLNAYRAEHLARSVVELNGQSLRDTDFVEVENEEVDEATGRMVLKPVLLERHAFVRDYVLSTWSREAIDVGFKKFNDVVAKSERESAKGVQFDAPDETSEEKYRRLLTEVREVEGELPMDLANRVLEENGYTKRITTQDFDVAQERLRNMQAVQESRVAEPQPVAAVEEPWEKIEEAEEEAPPPPMRPRPMSRPPVAAQSPQARPQPAPVRPATPSPAPAAPMSREASPEDVARLRQPIHGQTPAASAPPPKLSRSQAIAALEGGMDEYGNIVQEDLDDGILRPALKLDPKAAVAIFDQPPAVKMNPRFRPPPRS